MNLFIHRKTTQKAPTEILCVDETKLTQSFPDLQLKTDGY